MNIRELFEDAYDRSLDRAAQQQRLAEQLERPDVASYVNTYAVAATRAVPVLDEELARYYADSYPPSILVPPDPVPELDGPFSAWRDDTPGDAFGSDSAICLGARWASSREGVCVGLRWYSHPGSGAMPHTMGLYFAGGTLIVSVDTSAVAAVDGWNDVTIPPQTIAPGVNYWAVAALGSGTTYQYLALIPWPTVYDPITQNGGAYAYSSSLTFPDTPFTTAYGVDALVMTVADD